MALRRSNSKTTAPYGSAQNSVVAFPKLELLPSGAKSSSITLLQGTVYVSLMNTKGNEFSVKFGLQTVNLPPDSHIRLQLTPTEANLAVMHGEVWSRNHREPRPWARIRRPRLAPGKTSR